MNEKRKIYYLTNAEFDVQISKGMIISMKQTGDSYQTQYADEKLGFGGICILYEDVHKNIDVYKRQGSSLCAFLGK